jgi:Zn finger protein HypA/HybF involved in hydrogenase expression
VPKTTSMNDELATVIAPPVMHCQECLRLWLDPSERWRLYLDEDVEPALAVPYCAACASREFDGD